MSIQLYFEDGKAKIKDAETIDILRKTFYGVYENKELILDPEEALYLMDIRNAQCSEKGKELGFIDLAEKLMKPKLFARYATYKDWRDRGLVIRPIREAKGHYKKNPTVKYPSVEFKPSRASFDGLFFKNDMITIVDNPASKALYDKYWIGQWGTYKAEERGRILKLDPFETLFTVRHCGLKVRGLTEGKLSAALSEEPDFDEMYDVYEDWRLRGFVVKTGFKFGTHFRIYFPGAAPGKGGDWVHSRHVIHVFPRAKKMIIAEWARAIRVAHSVRKTFILAIPGKKTKAKKAELSFLLFHRKMGGGIETPGTDGPSFAMLSLAEDEMIGGAELAGAIEASKELGLDLVLAIADRETSVTHYRVKRIELPGSRYEYYEIEWAQP
jgi:tRNA-intron endonuclease